jgi:hypothetical protein
MAKGDIFTREQLIQKQTELGVAPVRTTTTTPTTSSNLGTGFTPTFESNVDDSLVKSAAKTVGNTPKSLFQLGKDVFTAVTNPIDTAKTVVTLAKGVGGKAAEKTLEGTDIGQTILQKMSDVRVSRGLNPLQKDQTGRIQAQNTPEIEVANKVGDYFNARYGSLDNFKQAAVEDPAGVLSDIASIVSGVGAGVKATGVTARLGNVADIGQTIQRVGGTLEPVSAVTKSVGAGVGTVANTTLGRAVAEATPTGSRIAEGQVVKALDLTQGDVARIAQKTGNNITDFMVRNDVFKETPEQIAMALDDLKEVRMADVRTPIAQVKTIYKKTDIPRVADALTTVQQSIDGVPGLENTLKEVNTLLAKPNYTLNDVQRAKEILDANSSIFNRMGDARQTATAEGLANIRTELRAFIETEVKKNTGVDIKPLNNDVATAVEISNAIENRLTRNQTRQVASVFDGILGFTAWGATGDPFIAAGIVLSKKLAETPSFRIALARTLSATPVEDISRWADEVSSGIISPETKQSLSQIIETAKRNAQFIESGSQVITEAQNANATAETR